MTSDARIISWISNLPPSAALPRLDATSPEDVAVTSCNNCTRKRKRTPTTPAYRLPSPPKNKSSPSEGQVSSSTSSAIGMEQHHYGSVSRDVHQAGADATPRDPQRFQISARFNANPDPDHSLEIDATPDLDPTPRSNRPGHRPPASRASSSHASSSLASYASELSLGSGGPETPSEERRRRQSSHRKQYVLMTMAKAVEHMNFDGDVQVPVALDMLVSRIESLAKGIGIVSHTEKETLCRQRGTFRRFRWVQETSFAPPPPSSDGPAKSARDDLGPTPTLETVNEIWTDADDCQNFQHFEGQWNCAVHFKLLQAALAHFRRLGFCNCTGAQIHPNYTRGPKVSHRSKKVDFCVFLDEQSPELTKAALTSPFQSVNQTEYRALRRRPIALSLETKVTGDGWTEAVNQISVWLLAQWDALDDLVLRTRRARNGAADDHPGDGEAAVANYEPKPSAAAAAGLVFLPGIIVQGHDWYFVAMTRSAEGKSLLYSRVLFGSTQSTEGVYKVVAVLQLLGKYIEDEYWPWFQQTVLANLS